MPTKALSSRLQGLKFMQRGAQREAEQAETDRADISSRTRFNSERHDDDEDDDPSPTTATDSSMSEQWVVPSYYRVKPKNSVQEPEQWESWFLNATAEDQAPTRQQFGAWKEEIRRPKTQRSENHLDPAYSDDATDDEEFSDNEEDQDMDESINRRVSETFRKSQDFRKPPSASNGPKTGTKRRASGAIPPKQPKIAAVADKSKGLRKKKESP